MDRVIIHCDMDNYYASVECLLNENLKNKPVAVCGSIDDRRGIVLARNNLAKMSGVKSAETIWQAKKKCPKLITVSPHFEEYSKYSKMAREIYSRFTDKIEAMGLDECWLDITRLTCDFSDGEKIAKDIKKLIKKELGLTISVGVSFNKIFAKIASDMNKPDGLTIISKANFKRLIWKKPIEDLIGIGKNSGKLLHRYGINTIGELAMQNDESLKIILGVQGIKLKDFANGIDNDSIIGFVEDTDIKSVGHGTTLKKDLKTEKEVWETMLELTKDISYRLKENKKRAGGIQIQIKDNKLVIKSFQIQFNHTEQSSFRLAERAFTLFKKMYDCDLNIRSITVQAINLIDEEKKEQKNLFINKKSKKIEKLEKYIDKINEKYGKNIVFNANFLEN